MGRIADLMEIGEFFVGVSSCVERMGRSRKLVPNT